MMKHDEEIGVLDGLYRRTEVGVGVAVALRVPFLLKVEYWGAASDGVSSASSIIGNQT